MRSTSTQRKLIWERASRERRVEMPEIQNERFRRALEGIPQAVPPIWFMRQAGRYHSHYQDLRKRHSFVDLCKKPELAAEVALGPISDFDFDVSILFSDLLFPLESLGMGLEYKPGPLLGWQLRPENIHQLARPLEAISSMEFQGKALEATRKILPEDKSLIGFVGGPWTLFAYGVEGSHKNGLSLTKKYLFLWPRFCEIILPFLQKNISLQLEAGAELVMIFDTAAGELSSQYFLRHIVPALQELVRPFGKKVAYYSKSTTEAHFRHSFFSGSLGGVGYDHRWNLPAQLKLRGNGKDSGGPEGLAPEDLVQNGFVQGNFDQGFLLLTFREFQVELDRYLTEFAKLSEGERAGWVCGLGHGVLPGTPEENVRFFVQRVREFFG